MQRNASHRLSAPASLDPLAVTVKYGTDGPDTIEGTTGPDDIYGYGGDDVLYGNGGADSLIGGVGYDYVLDGGNGDDTLNGGAGFDVAQFDYYYAGSAVTFTAANVDGSGAQVVVDAGVLGVDTLIGVEDLTVYGSAYADRITGGGGFDYLAGDTGADTLNGGAGDDTLAGQGGADALNGGAGYDSAEFDFYDRTSALVLNASAMNGSGAAITLGGDSLTGIESLIVYGSSAYSDTITGSGGDDVVYGYGGHDVLRGLAGFDYLWGGVADDSLAGGADDDQLEGDTGDDRLEGGAGYDTAVYDFSARNSGIDFSAAAVGTASSIVIGDGLGGTDTLIGVEAADLTGSDYDDSLTGSGGDDLLNGGLGDDTLAGGGGFDVATFDFYASETGVVFDASGVVPKSVVIVDAGMLGFDTLGSIEALDVYGSNYADTLSTGPGADYVQGFAGNDVLKSGSGADVLIGDEGDDRLNGASGADSLYGDAGKDVLVGGGGNDWLQGGAGADRFTFTVAPNDAFNQDTLDDFTPGSDRLQLDNAVFAGIGPAGQLAPTAFVAGTSATGAEDRIVYDNASGNLWFDSDGSGADAAILFALLNPGTALAADDIWVI